MKKIIDEARPGMSDYDFSSLQLIAEGGQGVVSSIKSKIDGKTYAAKQLRHLKLNNSTFD